jgi:hypothetical protein
MRVLHVPIMIHYVWRFCRRLALLEVDIVDVVYRIIYQQSFLLHYRPEVAASPRAGNLLMFNLKQALLLD